MPFVVDSSDPGLALQNPQSAHSKQSIQVPGRLAAIVWLVGYH